MAEKMDYMNWMLEVVDHRATFTLNRPQSNNDLTVETLHELREISNQVGRIPDSWVVVLQGIGDYFSSGIDLDIFVDRLNQPGEDLIQFVRDQQRCLDSFALLERPTIARINGFCIGGGLLMALCCDFRISSDRAIFSLPEIRLGIPPLWGAHRVTRTIGVSKAKEMVLLGKRYRAPEALDMGLVHQVVPLDSLDKVVDRFANQFTRLPPRSVGLTKGVIDRGAGLSDRDSQELELAALEKLTRSPDLQEAIDSYIRKRKPVFSGKY